MGNPIRDSFFKAWYWYISTVDKEGDITYMNYGHDGAGNDLDLKPEEEKDRYAIQLYHHLATKINLNDKSVLEVGCGRGGGLNFLKGRLDPESVTGLDLNEKAIKFCQNYHCQKNAAYVQGDAQHLPFESNSFDIILNVESSHRYPEPQRFFKEVHRVLRPGGYFLFTDFRKDTAIKTLEDQFSESKLKTEEKKDISKNVLRALDLATPQREKLINKLAPRIFKGLAKKFAATPGTPTYEKFAAGRFIYLTYVLKK